LRDGAQHRSLFSNKHLITLHFYSKFYLSHY
jgi:hypothetical protein